MDIMSLKNLLLKMESPFNWNIPIIDKPIEQYIKSQTEKCQNVDEESEFKWTSFVLHLLLAFELCDKLKDSIGAIYHIDMCVKHLEIPTAANCQELLFSSTKLALWHVTLATKAHILLAANQLEKAHSVMTTIKLLNFGDLKTRAGVDGIKAALFIQYGTEGLRLALESAKKARNLDPDQAEWWFIVGSVLGRIRRSENGTISTEEMTAIEKAFSLEKNATYTVHLAQLYADYSSSLYFQQQLPKSKPYAIKAVARFREAIEMRPKCASLKARVAHGLLKIRFKEIIDIKYAKQLLDEVIVMTPNNAMAYHDLGVYYDKFENNVEKAMLNLQKSHELRNNKAFLSLISLKWKIGLQRHVIDDLEKSLIVYKGDCQAELLTHLSACYLLIKDDWVSAINCVMKSLKIDPSAKYLQNYYGFKGRKTNFLEIITNFLRLQSENGKSDEFKSFLDLVKSKKPEFFRYMPQSTNFENWKKDQFNVKGSKGSWRR